MSGIFNCRACGAPMIFIKTERGKSMPCDAESQWYLETPDGEPFVMIDGTYHRGVVIAEKDPKARAGYVSHFATCPMADQFRKPRKSDRKKG